MPGDSGVTVVTNARVFYTTRAAAGASGARHSLRPLGPESITTIARMDSGLVRSLSSGRALRGPVGTPRSDGGTRPAVR
jgi:hypothetical protein